MKFLSKHSSILLYGAGIGIVFISIYFPRYTHESRIRRKTCREKEIEQIVHIIRVPDQTTFGTEYRQGRFRFQFSQEKEIELGSAYRVIGSIVDSLQCEKREQIPLKVRSISLFKPNRVSVFRLPLIIPDRIQLFLSKYQRIGETRIRRFLSPQTVDILFGMTVGQRPSTERVSQLFKETGLIHILVASGANVSIVAAFVGTVMRKIYSGKSAKMIALIGIILYFMVVGNQPPIVRSVGMYLWVVAAKVLGRRTSNILSLVEICFIMLVIQPFLIYSISFYLSFLATLGMLIGQKVVKMGDIRGSFFTSLIIFLFTAPLLIYVFGETTVLGVFMTVLTAWLIPFITMGGILLIVVSGLPFLPLTYILSLIVWFLIELLLRLINLFSVFSFLSFSITSLSIWHLFIWYMWLGLVCILLLAKNRRVR